MASVRAWFTLIPSNIRATKPLVRVRGGAARQIWNLPCSCISSVKKCCVSLIGRPRVPEILLTAALQNRSPKEPRRNILCIQTQPLPHGRGSVCAFDRAATVRERLPTFETFGHLIVSRPQSRSPAKAFRSAQEKPGASYRALTVVFADTAGIGGFIGNQLGSAGRERTFPTDNYFAVHADSRRGVNVRPLCRSAARIHFPGLARLILPLSGVTAIVVFSTQKDRRVSLSPFPRSTVSLVSISTMNPQRRAEPPFETSLSNPR
jgi:hypothetical protein